MLKNKNNYTAIVIAVFVIGFLLMASFFSVFNRLNTLMNDAFMRYSVNTPVSEKIIVIEANKSYSLQGDAVWLPLLKTLLAEDVAQVVFNFLPEHVSKDFYQLAATSNKVIFAQRVIKKTPSSNDLSLQDLPESAKGLNLNLGLNQELETVSGVYHSQYATIQVNDKDFPSLELMTAKRVLKDQSFLPQSNYEVNFSGGLARLPLMSIERVLSSGLVSELVAGRTVFVGVHDLGTVNRYFTPISSQEGLISAVFYQAFALDTLLSERLLNPIPIIITWGVIIFIILGSVIVFQRLSLQLSWLVAVFFSLLNIFLAWLLLHQFFLLMPLSELLLAQWLTFTLVWRYRLVQEKQFLDQMLFDLSLKLQEKVFPVSFYHSESPWEQLITMLNQTLDFKRLIFLERIPNKHRLKEISAFNCHINDIDEMRRDYERAPYSTAINESRAILLKTGYFKNPQPNEEEYLAPLVFAGEVLGFWAFTIDTSRYASGKFSVLIDAYMQQISEILHYRNEWIKRLQVEENKLLSYLRIEGGNDSYRMINQSVTLMDRRISELQQVFNSVTGSSILYDLFGRVLLVNKRMEELGQTIHIRPYNLSMLEFIIKITQFDIAKAQSLLQETIFDHKVAVFPVSCFDNNTNYMLHIKPLLADQQNVEHFAAETRVFQIIGVLCELIDVTEMKKIVDLKGQMFERFSFQMRNDMASVLFAVTLLKDQDINTDDKVSVLDSIHDKVDETLHTLELVKEQMGKDTSQLLDNSLECYPIDAKFSVSQAIAKSEAIIKTKQIVVHLQIPRLISLVFASPTELEDILFVLLTEMLADTYQAGELWLTLEEKDNRIHFRFKNTGIGIADSKLQQIMSPDVADSEIEEIAQLRHAIYCAKQWGGQLYLSSTLGEGSEIELLLRRFM